MLPTAKFAIAERAQIHDWLPCRQHAREEDHRRACRDHRGGENSLILEPVVARSVFQHIFECAQEQRHEDETDPVETLEQRQVGLVEIDQRGCGNRHHDAGHDVDEEQPMPGGQIGQVAADGRPNGRSERGHEPDDRRDHRLLRAWKNRVGRGEHRRHHAAADEALHRPPDDHLVHGRGQPAHQARDREAGGSAGEHDARAERAREKAGKRNRDHFRHQIRGLHPGDFVGRGGKSGLDLRKRCRNHLDVQERHEHAEAHGDEGNDACRIDALAGGRSRRERNACGRGGPGGDGGGAGHRRSALRISAPKRSGFAAAWSSRRARCSWCPRSPPPTCLGAAILRVRPRAAPGCAPAAAARSW